MYIWLITVKENQNSTVVKVVKKKKQILFGNYHNKRKRPQYRTQFHIWHGQTEI